MLMMNNKSILTALQKGDIQMEGQFLAGSNYTFLVDVAHEGTLFKAVYKPVRGEQPLWDFPNGTLAKREVAAYVVSEGLGWDLVPPTVYRRKGPMGAGSLQEFIEHEPHIHYFNFDETTRQRLRPVALFDIIANNADRKGGHILVDSHDHLWCIDHGICFHTDDKLRTVVWDFAGEEIPPNLINDLCRMMADLEIASELTTDLHFLLAEGEIEALLNRARQLASSGRFPYPQSTRRSYPWPPV
jgi:uncharacterized repeat protein (TIGR03843 family)